MTTTEYPHPDDQWLDNLMDAHGDTLVAMLGWLWDQGLLITPGSDFGVRADGDVQTGTEGRTLDDLVDEFVKTRPAGSVTDWDVVLQFVACLDG